MKDRLKRYWESHRSQIISVASVMVFLAAAVAVGEMTRGGPETSTEAAAPAAGEGEVPAGSPLEEGGAGTGKAGAGAGSGAAGGTAPGGVTDGGGAAGGSTPGGGGGSGAGGGSSGKKGGGGKQGSGQPFQTDLPGVTADEIEIAYYWKGDRTQSSPYLHGTGLEGNVDEAEAFRGLIDYINKHANGGATFMGFPFDLHGRKLVPTVVEAGQSAEQYAAAATKVAKELRPFAAVSAHGSLSTYTCPIIAAAGIHNFATYDLGDGSGRPLLERTNGYCLPSGLAWEGQVQVTMDYLKWQAQNDPYTGVPSGPRRYGFLYAEYPGLKDSAPKVIEQMKQAGIPIVAAETLSESLSTAQQQAPGVVAAFRGANVNTIISPDAGALLNFTHAAAANAYTPDYYVWPCSGQDSSGMVRLYNAAQWRNASGLTCYDDTFDADLTTDDRAKRTEWYRQFREVKRSEPPSPTAIVYASLLPVLAGITNAGYNLNLASFRKGLADFDDYRYDGEKGRTSAPDNILVTIGSNSMWGDVARVRWSPTTRKEGSPMNGAYVYPEDRRYRPGQTFG